MAKTEPQFRQLYNSLSELFNTQSHAHRMQDSAHYVADKNNFISLCQENLQKVNSLEVFPDRRLLSHAREIQNSAHIQ